MAFASADQRRLERSQLTEIFKQAERQREVPLIGIEHEKISYRLQDGGPVPYRGPQSIHALLMRLCTIGQWQPYYVEGNILAATKARSQVTLEPGGQVELSGTPFASVADVRCELEKHMREIISVGESLGIGFSSLGFHPLREPDDIEFVPKPRYPLMRRYFKRTGTRGRYMMANTATVQVNHDFASEAEAVEKFRVAQLISPYLAAIFANSPFEHGKLTEWQSRRYFTWLDVDPSRSGLLPFAYRDDFSYDAYVQWALAAPVFGIVRDGLFMAMGDITFGDFLDQGYEGQHAVHADWEDHLGTLFPEVRLKRTIEVRSVDSGSLPHAIAVVAACRGLLDVPSSRRIILSDFAAPKRITEFQREVAKSGVNACTESGPILDRCRTLARLAQQGLYQLGDPAASDALLPVFDALADGCCPADEWRHASRRNLDGISVLRQSVFLRPRPRIPR